MIRIGMIGLDTSHSVAFTELLNNASNPHHVPGGQVVAAFSGSSPDFPFGAARVQGFTEELSGKYGVRIMDSIEAVAEASDVILLESADGRVHLEQFKVLAPYGKPVFIDKPLSVYYRDAVRIAELADRHSVRLMSSSSLRYSTGLEEVLRDRDFASGITGAEAFGPLEMLETQPGFFWYGVHTAEMLYRIMGRGCKSVSASSWPKYDLIAGEWEDGRIGTVRGAREGMKGFGALLYGSREPRLVDVTKDVKPFYASLVERIMEMFTTGRVDVPVEETLELIRFLEAANESVTRGGSPVRL